MGCSVRLGGYEGCGQRVDVSTRAVIRILSDSYSNKNNK